MRQTLVVFALLSQLACNVTGRQEQGGTALKDDEATPPPPGGATIPDPPDYVEDLNGWEISGFEYWPWITGMGNPYAENRVQFGYDNFSSQAAQDCTKLAFAQLHRILQNPGEWLVKLKNDTDAPRRFFLWNNDYTQYNQNHGATVYNWKNSYIKWQHYTDKQGKCWIPGKKTLEDFAQCEHKKKTQNLTTECSNTKMYLSSTIDPATQMPFAN